MKTINLKALASACAVVALLHSTAALHAENVHLGKDGASTEEIINLLMPKPGNAKVRGLRLKNVTKTAPGDAVAESASISMEIYFAFDSAELSHDARSQLASVGDALRSQELASLQFALEGHTDASGEESYNLSLSERRALSVRNFFVQEYGISADRLQPVGRGEYELLDPQNPTSGVNRRVKIITQ